MSLADLAHLSPAEQRELSWFSAAQGQTDPKQLGGKPQVWKVGGRYFVAYYIPGTNVPMVWEASEMELRDKYGGAGAPMPAIDRQMDEAQFRAISPWLGGRISEIRNTQDDPWSQFFSDYRKGTELRPWMKDPEILSVYATAYLEGREVTPDDLAATEWWNKRTASERAWLEESATLGDAEIESRRSQRRRDVINKMLEFGLKNVDQRIIDIFTDRTLSGEWEAGYAEDQMRALADPAYHVKLNKVINDIALEGKTEMGRTEQYEEQVRNMAIQWLGPTMGQMDQAGIELWAGRFRNNPTEGEALFMDHLRKQRLAIFPEFNENLTYEDIVAPVRNLATNIWGQPITDETMRVDLANMRDYTEASKRLRKTGLDKGVGKVVDDALGELGSTAMGERVVRSTI